MLPCAVRKHKLLFSGSQVTSNFMLTMSRAHFSGRKWQCATTTLISESQVTSKLHGNHVQGPLFCNYKWEFLQSLFCIAFLCRAFSARKRHEFYPQ